MGKSTHGTRWYLWILHGQCQHSAIDPSVWRHTGQRTLHHCLLVLGLGCRHHLRGSNRAVLGSATKVRGVHFTLFICFRRVVIKKSNILFCRMLHLEYLTLLWANFCRDSNPFSCPSDTFQHGSNSFAMFNSLPGWAGSRFFFTHRPTLPRSTHASRTRREHRSTQYQENLE
jgi:hypothetical protein